MGRRAVAQLAGVCPACCRLGWVQVPAETSEAAVSFVHRFPGAQLAFPSMPTAAALLCSSLSEASLEKPKRSDSTLQTGGIASVVWHLRSLFLCLVWASQGRQPPATLPACHTAGPSRRLPENRPLVHSPSSSLIWSPDSVSCAECGLVQVHLPEESFGPAGSRQDGPAPRPVGTGGGDAAAGPCGLLLPRVSRSGAAFTATFGN